MLWNFLTASTVISHKTFSWHCTFSWHSRYLPVFLLTSVTLFLVSSQDLSQCEKLRKSFHLYDPWLHLQISNSFFFPKILPKNPKLGLFCKTAIVFCSVFPFQALQRESWSSTQFPTGRMNISLPSNWGSFSDQWKLGAHALSRLGVHALRVIEDRSEQAQPHGTHSVEEASALCECSERKPDFKWRHQRSWCALRADSYSHSILHKM